MKRGLLVALLLLGGLAAAGLGYLWATPRLIEISPPPDATGISAGTSLRLTFSQPMRVDSVRSHLSINPYPRGQFSQEGNSFVFTPDEPWPNGAEVTVRLAAGVRAAGWLPFTTRREQSWSFLVENPLLAYLYPSDGPANVYTIDPESGEVTLLTEETEEVLDFDVNATGTEIYYSVRRGEGNSAILRLERSSGESHPVLNCEQALCRAPQISLDGRYLAYERVELGQNQATGQVQVWLLPLSQESDPGGDEQASQPIPAGDPEQRTQSPLWSTDGWLSFYNYAREAFIFTIPGEGEKAEIASLTGLPGSWDPHGKFFVFPEMSTIPIDPALTVDLAPLPFSHLMRYDLSDGTLEDLSLMDYLEDAFPAYSPDGKRLAFARKYLNQERWTPGRQLWVMAADGSNTRQLTDDPQYNHYDFAWSPSGEAIAYTRFNQTLMTEPPQVWLINADGSQPQQLVSGGYAPQWIP